MSTTVLCCGRARVAVEADEALLDELGAVCRPWITPSPAAPVPAGTWSVRIRPDARGDAVPSRTGTAVYLDAPRHTLHLPLPHRAGVRPVVRLLRALMRRQLAADGALFLDAAALALGDGGVALVGGSRAGKTTTLIATLHRRHGALVANDDASVHVGADGRVTARGYPRGIEVRRDVLCHLASSDALLAAAEADGPAHALYVEPHRLADALDASLTETAALSALVLLAHGTGRPELQRLTPQNAAAAVTTHCAAADPYESWLEQHLPAPQPGLAQKRQLVQSVPVWRLVQPLTALAESADLLADLSDSPGGSR